MKPLSVAFYSPTKNFGSSYKDRATKNLLVVNPTPYYLHGYFKKNYAEFEKYVNWQPSILRSMTAEQLLEYINFNNIDVLCISLYLWNIDQILDTVAKVKLLCEKDIKIVAGGPSASVLKEELSTKYKFIDHCIIGQGEKAWAQLVLDFLGIKAIGNDIKNVVRLVKKDDKLPNENMYEYEFVREIHYSPYLECKDLVIELQNFYKDYELIWPYETQRGCPYHCTFCDWNGGQSNKVQKRKQINFLDEIDFFAENKMYKIFLADANFGMWDIDVEIMRRFVYHKIRGHNFMFESFNMNKKVNENFKEIMQMIIEHNFNTDWLKLSVQDVNQEVLDAINRPGNWADVKKFGRDMYAMFDNKKNIQFLVELIMGLPGQTVESFVNSLNQVYSQGFVAWSYPFLLLETSPAAYDTQYRQKYGIQDEMVYEVLHDNSADNTIAGIMANPLNNFLCRQLVETNSFTKKDLVEMTMIDQLYYALYNLNHNYKLVDVNWDSLQPIAEEIIKSKEFKSVLDQRYNNFVNYKINAMESKQGTLMFHGSDMRALIGKNFYYIITYLKNTNMQKNHIKEFYNFYKNYLKYNYLLDDIIF